MLEHQNEHVVRDFIQRLRQFSSHATKCHACHGICTLSPLDAALTLRFAKNEPQDTSKALRQKTSHLLKTSQKQYCACHTKRFSTRLQTRENIKKSRACHAKRSYAMLETSKSDPFCRTYQRHGHTALTRTVANGCGRLRTVAQRRANTPSTPRPPEWNGNPCYAFGKIATAL